MSISTIKDRIDNIIEIYIRQKRKNHLLKDYISLVRGWTGNHDINTLIDADSARHIFRLKQYIGISISELREYYFVVKGFIKLAEDHGYRATNELAKLESYLTREYLISEKTKYRSKLANKLVIDFYDRQKDNTDFSIVAYALEIACKWLSEFLKKSIPELVGNDFLEVQEKLLNEVGLKSRDKAYVVRFYKYLKKEKKARERKIKQEKAQAKRTEISNSNLHPMVEEYLAEQPGQQYQIPLINGFLKWMTRRSEFSGRKFYEIPIEFISEGLVNNYLAELDRDLASNKKKAATVQKSKIALRAWLRFLYQKRYTPNYARFTINGVPKKDHRRFFSLEICERILIMAKKITPPQVFTAFALSLAVAARCCELARLEIDDIDLQQKNITLIGKRKKIRTIPLPEAIVPLIKDYLAIRPQTDDRRFFVKHNGSGYERDALMQTLNHYLRKVLKKLNPNGGGVSGMHTFRHILPNVLLAQGEKTEDIAEILGIKIDSLQIYLDLEKEQIHKEFNEKFPLR